MSVGNIDLGRRTGAGRGARAAGSGRRAGAIRVKASEEKWRHQITLASGSWKGDRGSQVGAGQHLLASEGGKVSRAAGLGGCSWSAESLS